MFQESKLTLQPFPTYATLKQWKSSLKASVLVASDRTDRLAAQWVDMVANDRNTFAELAIIPPQMPRMDLELAMALKRIFPKEGKYSYLFEEVLAEETARSERGILPLAGLQILRLMYRSFRTTESLKGDACGPPIG